MGTHGRGLLSHFVLGNEAERVTRYSSCPVMTVNQLGHQIDIADEYNNILVPHDSSEYSTAGLRYAIALADMFDASITIQHIFETFPHPAIYMQNADTPALSSMEMKTRAKEIIRHREEYDIDLVIMSTRGHGALEAFFIGTTADKIIRKVPCPVLAVKEHQRDFI